MYERSATMKGRSVADRPDHDHATTTTNAKSTETKHHEIFQICSFKRNVSKRR